MTGDCIFCKIKNMEIPSEMLYVDHMSFVIRDINPAASTHMLVIPLEHVTAIEASCQEQMYLISHLIMVAKQMVDQESDLSDNGWRLVINQGKHAGQQISHLHIHILGGQPLGSMA